MAPRRILLNLSLDLALTLLALPLALWVAAPGAWPPGGWWPPALSGLVAAFLAVAVPLGLPRQYWRFAGLPDQVAVVGASLGTAALFWAGLHAFGGWRPPNLAFPAVHAAALVTLLGGARAIGRLRHSHRAGPVSDAPPRSALLAGSGEAADLFLRALAAQRSPGFQVLGLLAPRARQAGRRIQGVPILGALDDAAEVLERLRADGRLPALLVVVGPDLSGKPLEALLDAADRHGIAVRRAPRPTTLDPAALDSHGERNGAPARRLVLRPVGIEELLDRPQVPLDREGMARLVQGRRVLVTGAGGTIGGELARQVAALGPAMLTLLDHGEFALYSIDLELGERHPTVPRRAVLADVRDEARLKRLVEETRPELVFHAAALKHVPMVENDPAEGLLTNAQGTRIVADAARAAGATAMVFISTDKAVNPTSVMGASKRLAEMYCQALDVQARQSGGMRCVTVRFGNVLGSTGSVVPLFRRQLERGGPLTVTHPDMRRYFMTVREAVGLVLQASVVGVADAEEFRAGGAAGAGDRAGQPPELREGGIFVLDMGEPVKIVDLARRMIRLAGLRPDEDVEIRFTGLRPGEKLYEELFHGQEPPRPTQFPGLLVATPRTADAALVGRAIDEIAAACRTGQPRAALAQLARLVPEFDHDPHHAAAGRA
ncbi:polysaccharide biosynthesis protein [Roseomonas sp. OT10]|uniref:polysaccharide biosynthesis protein n=1 Tax=Roseomonas cutis TaxID=2897332 RepID=UPI001E6279BF|nr:nucleoside-diphosphate sugar epimerase/dehydratase [Roseomonas sp. OT10]UFN50493.1 polysaccharide biosynthesis protein [Roseomonas sp. OT10]